VLPHRVPVSAFYCYHVPLQRKKCCQQIIGLNDESFSIAVCIDAEKKSVLKPQSSFAAICGAGALLLAATVESYRKIAELMIFFLTRQPLG